MTFKPLLAATLDDLSQVRFPVMASPKLDGIRCVIRGGAALSRSLKPIPNDYVRAALSGLPDLDGELIVGSPTAPDCFTKSTSGVMSRDGEPDFYYHVFDKPDMEAGFADRLRSLDSLWLESRVVPVKHTHIDSDAALMDYESQMVSAGYEGVMLRDPNGVYKHGRSTLKEGILLKLKRFADDDGEVIGFEELLHNQNAAIVNALGHTERSGRNENKIAGDTLGALIMRAPGWPEPFRIGTGFTLAMRDDLWSRRSEILGARVKFKHQPSGAAKAPRFPVFIGFRSDLDQ